MGSGIQILIVASVSHGAVRALLDDHAPRLQAEKRLVLARLPAHQQLERAVGRLELEAAVLELLDALGYAQQCRVVELDPRLAGLLHHRRLTREL